MDDEGLLLFMSCRRRDIGVGGETTIKPDAIMLVERENDRSDKAPINIRRIPPAFRCQCRNSDE